MPTGNPAKPAKTAKPAAKPASAGGRAPAKTSSARRPVGYALLVAAAALLGYLLLAQSPSVDLAKDVPASVSVFLEVPSAPKLVAGLGKLKIGDAQATEKDTTEAFLAALSGAFKLTHGDAETLGRSMVGAAVAGRVSGAKLASVWLVAFSSKSAAELLLGSDRLTADGPVGKSGAGYKVAPTAATAPHALDASALEKWLRTLSTRDDGARVAWFGEPRVLAIGDDALLRDVAAVLDTGTGALADAPAWKQAKAAALAATPGAQGVFFADEKALRDLPPLAGQQALLDGFVRDGGAVSGALSFGPAGVVLHATLPVTGDALPEGKGVVAASKLTLPARLPETTAFYLGVSLHRDLDAASTKAELLRSARAAQGLLGLDVGKGLTDVEAATGLPVDELFRMAGDEAVLALVLGKDFRYSATEPIVKESLTSAGVVFAMKVDSDVSALRTLTRLREAIETTPLGGLADYTSDGEGSFIARPRQAASQKLAGMLGGGLPTLQVRYRKKLVVVALGQQAMLDSIFAALDEGKETLAGDAAHTQALAALRPDARAYAWLDLAKVATLVYAANPGAKLDAKSRGWPVDALSLAGPTRVTEALALDYRADATHASVDVDALNPWGPALVTGWLLSVPGARPPGMPFPVNPQGAQPAIPKLPRPPGFPSPPGAQAGPDAVDAAGAAQQGIPDPLGVMPSCKMMLKRIEQCEAFATSPDAKARFKQKQIDERARISATPPERLQFENAECGGQFFRLKNDPDCPKLEMRRRGQDPS